MFQETDITRPLFYIQFYLPDYEQKGIFIHLFSST
jgi:hypothetical protein